MRQVYQQDQTKKEEEHGADQSNVVAPEHEESIGDEECKDDQGKPGNDLGPPVAILYRRARILGRVDADEKDGKDEVEKTERKVDSVDSKPSVTIPIPTADFNVVEHYMLEFLDCPFREHDP